MKKIGLALAATSLLLTSACAVNGISREDLASSDRIEAAVMTPPPPSATQCSRARSLRQTGYVSLSKDERGRVDDVIARCSAATH